MSKNKLNKISLILIITLLIIPCCVFAEGENENTGGETNTEETTATPTPSESPIPSEEPKIEVISISLKKSTLTLVEGENETLKVAISPENATNQTIVWSSSDERIAKVNQEGVVTAVSEGTTTIVATSNNGKTANCIVAVTKKKVIEETKSSDATIKKLSIKNGTLDKTFNSNTTEYTVTVNKDAKELEFEYAFNNSKASKYITNNSSIKTGSIVSFKVIAEDGKTTKTYKFTVKKEEANLNLKSLKIKGYTLNESFSSEKLEYTANIPYEAVDVTIQAAAEDDKATVTIKGASSLIVGQNTVTIIVKDTSGNEREYRITVTRSPEDEREITGNSSKYSSTTSHKTSTTTTTQTNSTRNNHTLRYVIVTIGSIILFTIGAIGIYFYIKTSTKKQKKDKNNKKTQSNIKKEEANPETSKTTTASSIMPGDLEATREFKTDDIINVKNEKIRKATEELLDEE